MQKLSKRFVDALPAQGSDYFSWDADLAGFGVRVWPSGVKNFIVQYRSAGRTRRLKLGNYGALTVEEARREAKIALGDVARGGDPQEDRVTRRRSLTVTELCDNYLAAADSGLIFGKGGRAKKAGTLYVDRGRIERHIKPLLGAKLVRDVTAADINRFIRDVTTGKTAGRMKTGRLRGHAIVEGGAGTATRTTGLLGGILSFAVSEGVIPFSPSRGVKRPADQRRTRRLSATEYRAIGAALAGDFADIEEPQAVTGAWLLALTGCRLGEIVGLRWSEVDPVGGCFRLTDTKEGASVRPMGRPVFEILNDVDREGDSVLPGVRGEGAFGSLPAAWRRLMKQAGIEGVTPHTMRHSFASVAGDLGFSDSTIAAMLGHAAGSVTSRYVHRLDTVLIAAADKISGEVWRQMTSAD